jgi:hypothetical protein
MIDTRTPLKPSAEAVEMLARLMLQRSMRESPELFPKPVENKPLAGSILRAKQLSLPLDTDTKE